MAAGLRVSEFGAPQERAAILSSQLDSLRHWQHLQRNPNRVGPPR